MALHSTKHVLVNDQAEQQVITSVEITSVTSRQAGHLVCREALALSPSAPTKPAALCYLACLRLQTPASLDSLLLGGLCDLPPCQAQQKTGSQS